MNRRELGALGEALALRYMQERGFVLLAKNYRALRCEIDLVLRDGKTIVFAEVKTRAASSAAAAYLAAYSLHDACVRFDVLEVDAANNSVTHIPGAFTL